MYIVNWIVIVSEVYTTMHCVGLAAPGLATGASGASPWIRAKKGIKKSNILCRERGKGARET